jgi:hypothetical protein
MIHLDESVDGDRIDAVTLPHFASNSCCATCGWSYGVRVNYCSGCGMIG